MPGVAPEVKRASLPSVHDLKRDGRFERRLRPVVAAVVNSWVIDLFWTFSLSALVTRCRNGWNLLLEANGTNGLGSASWIAGVVGMPTVRVYRQPAASRLTYRSLPLRQRRSAVRIITPKGNQRNPRLDKRIKDLPSATPKYCPFQKFTGLAFQMDVPSEESRTTVTVVEYERGKKTLETAP